MSFSIGTMELVVLAILILAIVRPGILKKLLRFADDYFSAEYDSVRRERDVYRNFYRRFARRMRS